MMGIRDEIEGLKEYLEPHCTTWQESGIVEATINEVLSILDEHLGECVGEAFCKEGELNLSIFGPITKLLMKTSRAGDHISIYVRKEKQWIGCSR